MVEYDNFGCPSNVWKSSMRIIGNPNAYYPNCSEKAVAESVIQRFETCYDCLWKVLKRYLVEELGVANAPNSPSPSSDSPSRTI